MGNNYLSIVLWIRLLWFDVERIWETTDMHLRFGTHRLWFDVERIWETTSMEFAVSQMQLWFDVERIWETTSVDISWKGKMLWFDVERIWETTRHLHLRSNPPVVVWCRTDTGNNATPLVLISPPVVVWCRTDTGNNDPDDKTVPFQSTDPVRFINYMTGGLVNSCVTSERQVKTPGNTAMYIIPWLTSRTLECIFFHGMRRSCYVTTSIQETWQ